METHAAEGNAVSTTLFRDLHDPTVGDACAGNEDFVQNPTRIIIYGAKMEGMARLFSQFFPTKNHIGNGQGKDEGKGDNKKEPGKVNDIDEGKGKGKFVEFIFQQVEQGTLTTAALGALPY